MSRYSLKPQNNLKVEGQGLTPRPSPSVSPVSTCSLTLSDHESEGSNGFTLLDGLRETNAMLETKLQQLRQLIASNEQRYNAEKEKIKVDNETQFGTKDKEIKKLKESLEESNKIIEDLEKTGAENDKIIREKCLEIDELKRMVDEIKEEAQRIKRKVKQAKMRQKKNQQEDESQDKEKQEEINLLEKEADSLKSKLTAIKDELDKAIKALGEQNDKIKTLGTEKLDLQAKFEEELEKLSKSMRREWHRINEVMQTNIDETIKLRKDNSKIHEELHILFTETKRTISKIQTQNHHNYEAEQSASTNTRSTRRARENRAAYGQQNANTTQRLNGQPEGVNEQPGIENGQSQRVQRQTHANELAESREDFCTNKKLPPIQTRESTQFSTTRSHPQNLQLQSLSTTSLNNRAVSKSTNNLSDNPATNAARPFSKGKRQRANHMSTQLISLPYNQNIMRTQFAASLDTGRSAANMQFSGRGGVQPSSRGGVQSSSRSRGGMQPLGKSSVQLSSRGGVQLSNRVGEQHSEDKPSIKKENTSTNFKK